MPFSITPSSPILPPSQVVQEGEGSEGEGIPPPFSPLSASIRSRTPSPMGTPRSSPLSSPRTPTGHQEADFSSGSSTPNSPSPAVTRSRAAEGSNRRFGREVGRRMPGPLDSGVGCAGRLMPPSPARDNNSSSGSSGLGELRLSGASQEAPADSPGCDSLQSQD